MENNSTNSNPGVNSGNQESSFKNVSGYGNGQQPTSDNEDKNNEDDGRDKKSESDKDKEADSEGGSGFAKPQVDDWPEEDESVDNPGGPTTGH